MLPKTAWKPGQSGNPKGRQRIDITLKASCNALTPEGLERLKDIIRNGTDADAIKAIALVFAYGHGKPKEIPDDDESVDGEATRVLLEPDERLKLLDELRRRLSDGSGTASPG